MQVVDIGVIQINAIRILDICLQTVLNLVVKSKQNNKIVNLKLFKIIVIQKKISIKVANNGVNKINVVKMLVICSLNVLNHVVKLKIKIKNNQLHLIKIFQFYHQKIKIAMILKIMMKIVNSMQKIICVKIMECL
jgi:hypothetical protein